MSELTTPEASVLNTLTVCVALLWSVSMLCDTAEKSFNTQACEVAALAQPQVLDKAGNVRRLR